MSELSEILQRLDTDSAFRAAVEADPARALDGFNLTDTDLAAIDQALRTPPTPVRQFFRPGPAGGKWAAAMLAGLTALGLGGGLALGKATSADPQEPVALMADGFPVYACPGPNGPGEQIAETHRGDQLWVVGTGAEGWVAVRQPTNLAAIGWMRANQLELGDVSGLPTIPCEPSTVKVNGEVQTSTTLAITETTSTVPVDSNSTTTTTTTTSSSSTVPITAPVTNTTPPPDPTVTIPTKDTTPPTITASANVAQFYSDNNLGCNPTSATVSASAIDDRGTATIESVKYQFTGRNGAIQQGSLTGIGPGQWRLGPFSVNVPDVTPTAIPVTIVAVDTAGNRSTTTVSITLRPHGLDCIG